MGRATVVLLALLASACAPEVVDGQFTCSDGECPLGFACCAGRCQRSCLDAAGRDAGPRVDGGRFDGGRFDAGPRVDAGDRDAALMDVGVGFDAGRFDAGRLDAGPAPHDAGLPMTCMACARDSECPAGHSCVIYGASPICIRTYTGGCTLPLQLTSLSRAEGGAANVCVPPNEVSCLAFELRGMSCTGSLQCGGGRCESYCTYDCSGTPDCPAGWTCGPTGYCEM
ncbi:MAG: hypothetical protein AB7S26_28205 [Sandaracinaceae bacterium]